MLIDITKNQLLQKQFKKYQQINRILDSQPQTLQAKDQKIRSLTILLKREFDQNKLLSQQILNLKHVNQTLNLQIMARSNQSKNYQKQICKQVDQIAQKNIQQRKQKLQIQQLKQQVQQSKQIILKMKNQHKSTLISMQTQITFLKAKTLQNYQSNLNLDDECSCKRKQNIEKTYLTKTKNRQLSKTKLQVKSSSRPKTQRTVSFCQKKINSSSQKAKNLKNFVHENIVKMKNKEIDNEQSQNCLKKSMQKNQQLQFSFDNFETARKNFMKNVQNLPNFKGQLKKIQLQGCKFYQ